MKKQIKQKKKNKHLIIKEKICEALEGRKEKEEAILSLFFGIGEMREEGIKKFKGMYKGMIKNIKKMDNATLKNVYEAVQNTGEHLI